MWASILNCRGELKRRWSGKRDSNSQPSAWKADALAIELFPHHNAVVLRRMSPTALSAIFMVEGGGFEPPKSYDDRFTVCSLWPLGNPSTWSWRWDSNPQPADYKSAALPVELRQPTEMSVYIRLIHLASEKWRFLNFFFRSLWISVKPSGLHADPTEEKYLETPSNLQYWQLRCRAHASRRGLLYNPA